MRRSRFSAGFTIVDLLLVLVVVTVVISLALPTLARVRGDSMVQESMNNLVTLSVAPNKESELCLFTREMN